ncbi:hypothetical protein [Longispora albida]|uniref:hypothetical protein n=1 Tax=Longispora albida TaxID=203523 RepID=UPI0003625B09|nr:hypothetical protein [Longispora albida]
MRKKIALAAVAMTAALAPLAVATPAQADTNGPSGCNKRVCIYTAYTGSGWQVWGEFNVNINEGHIDFWGPNGFRQSSPNGYWPAGHDTARFSGSGSGQLCAQGWSRVGGVWYSYGLPCVNM